MKLFLVGFLAILALEASSALPRNDWWQNGNFYQIYPRSFKDSDGDGIGDLNGVTEKLNYLKDIGMDGVWLSPIFKSPMADFGYDISDYYNIQPEYGSVDDLVRVIEKAHAIGLYLILDFVPNHTSDEHEWFQRSVNGDPEFRDFYIWHDGVLNKTTGKREPPSNWVSAFRYSAWEWNEKRQQYYLHQFAVKQPDLNYRNPAVIEALNDVLRFWLAKGIDGFRIDAKPYFFEAEIDPATGTYPDEPVIDDVSACPDPDDYCHLKHIYTKDSYENTKIIFQWRELVNQWKATYNTDTKILLTEAYEDFNLIIGTYGDGVHNGSHIPFNFEMMSGLNNQSTASDYQYYIEHWLNNMPEDVYANWVLGNHDNPRLATRFGGQRKDLMNILLQTLPGIAVTYNGEEYGMENVYVSWEETVDTQGCSTNPDVYLKYSRDPERTPFRWDDSKNAGFSNASHTWLPVGEGYQKENVAAQLRAPNSHLKIFKHLVQLRKTETAFDDGDINIKVVDNALLYKRKAPTGDAFIIVLNIGDNDLVLNLSQYFDDVNQHAQLAVSSLQSGIDDGELVEINNFKAKAFVGYVLRLVNIERS